MVAVEQAAACLEPLVADGTLEGYDSPTRFLPSQATQAARRAALQPEPGELARRLQDASDGLPLSAARLQAFIDDVAAARVAPVLTREALAGSHLGTQGWGTLTPCTTSMVGASCCRCIRLRGT